MSTATVNWITGGALVLYIAFTVMVTEWRTHFRRTMNELDSHANTRAIDSLLNYETVKYFGAERREAERYDGSMAKYEKASTQTYVSLAVLNAGQAAIIEKRVDLASFKDPDKLQRFVQRFTAIWDAQNNAASAPVLNLFADSTAQGLDASLLLSLQRIRFGS